MRSFNQRTAFVRHRVWRRWPSAILLIVVGMWIALALLGRQAFSDSGFGVWTGAHTRHTSQWIADPYTFTHVPHGIIFYWLLLPLCGRLTLASRFVTASFLEAAWEVLENTPYVIDRYRVATAALDYYGDSILNSTFDLIAAMLGFYVASRFNWKPVLAFVILLELLLAYFIRDNLTLNILMLLFPLDSLKAWQEGGL